MIEFLSKDRVRVGFLGVCKSGKSWACWQATEELLDSGAQWALIHDTIREPQYPPEEIDRKNPGKYPRILITNMKQCTAALQTHRRLVFRYPITAGEVSALAMHLRRIYPEKSLVVVFDELDSESINNDGRWVDKRVHDLYHQGRGLHILGCSQRVLGMPRGARGLHDVWFVFRLTTDECKDLKGYGVTEWALVRIPKLPRGRFIPLSLT